MKKLEELVYSNANIVCKDDINLNYETDLIEVLGYDSLSMVKLIIAIENYYGIEIEDFNDFGKYGLLKKYVCTHSKFNDFYKNYILGEPVEESNEYQIVLSEQRQIPINKKYHYCIIMTRYFKKNILSCSKEMIIPLINNIKNSKQNFLEFDDYINLLSIENCTTRKMLRMIGDKEPIKVTIPNQNIEYLYIDEVMKFVAKKDGNIISYCKISDVNNGFGNVVVYTDEPNRKQGYATYLLSLLLAKCKELNICPMYVVDKNNITSINLANRMGFSVVSEEIVASKILLDENAR